MSDNKIKQLQPLATTPPPQDFSYSSKFVSRGNSPTVTSTSMLTSEQQDLSDSIQRIRSRNRDQEEEGPIIKNFTSSYVTSAPSCSQGSRPVLPLSSPPPNVIFSTPERRRRKVALPPSSTIAPAGEPTLLLQKLSVRSPPTLKANPTLVTRSPTSSFTHYSNSNTNNCANSVIDCNGSNGTNSSADNQQRMTLPFPPSVSNAASFDSAPLSTPRHVSLKVLSDTLSCSVSNPSSAPPSSSFENFTSNSLFELDSFGKSATPFLSRKRDLQRTQQPLPLLHFFLTKRTCSNDEDDSYNSEVEESLAKKDTNGDDTRDRSTTLPKLPFPSKRLSSTNYIPKPNFVISSISDSSSNHEEELLHHYSPQTPPPSPPCYTPGESGRRSRSFQLTTPPTIPQSRDLSPPPLKKTRLSLLGDPHDIFSL